MITVSLRIYLKATVLSVCHACQSTQRLSLETGTLVNNASLSTSYASSMSYGNVEAAKLTRKSLCCNHRATSNNNPS